MRDLEILVDVSTCELKLSQVLALVYDYLDNNPFSEVWLDGDLNAIVAEVRPL